MEPQRRRRRPTGAERAQPVGLRAEQLREEGKAFHLRFDQEEGEEGRQLQQDAAQQRRRIARPRVRLAAAQQVLPHHLYRVLPSLSAVSVDVAQGQWHQTPLVTYLVLYLVSFRFNPSIFVRPVAVPVGLPILIDTRRFLPSFTEFFFVPVTVGVAQRQWH